VQGGRRFPHPDNPEEALALLVDGHRRHQENRPELRDHSPVEYPAVRQQPFAAIISCADSRVSPTQIEVVASVYDIKTGRVSLI
jgi:carbonic anhydrase